MGILKYSRVCGVGFEVGEEVGGFARAEYHPPIRRAQLDMCVCNGQALFDSASLRIDSGSLVLRRGRY